MGCTFSGSKSCVRINTRGSNMFKFVFSAAVCAAMCIPAASFAQNCGCEPAPAPCCEAPAPSCAPKTRKRLKLVDTQRKVCTFKRVCTTDCCGCPKSKLVRDSKTVSGKRLALVDTPVDPCRKGLLKRLCGRVGSMRAGASCGCAAPAPAPCGCEAPAPAPCGCDAPAPAPCGCDGGAAPMIESPIMDVPMMDVPMGVPTLAPAPCCGG